MKKFKEVLMMSTIILAMSTPKYNVMAEEMSLIQVAEDISLRVIVDEINYIETEGQLADITIQERSIGALTESRDSDERTLVFSLEGTNYEFSKLPKVSLSGGFSKLSVPEVEYAWEKGKENPQVIYITMPRNSSLTSKGQMTLSNIEVRASELKTGELNLKIGRLAEETYTKVKVAQVAKYGVHIEGEKRYSLTAGGSKEISCDVEEELPDTFVSGRKMEISIDKGFFKTDIRGNIIVGDIYLNSSRITHKVTLEPYEEGGVVKSFTMILPELNTTKRNVISFEGLELGAGLEDQGEIILAVGGRALPEEASTVIADIDIGTTIQIKKINAAVGVKKQVGGAITISEQDRKSLELGYIEIRFEGSPYISYTKVPNVEVTKGDLGLKVMGWSDKEDNVLLLKVTKKSTKPSTIMINDFTFNVSNTAPDGTFGVSVGGEAISPDDEQGEMKFSDFMKVSEFGDNSGSNNNNSNNNSNSNNSSERVTKFVLGSKTYFVNGKANEMDAVPFSQDGRTMVPVRYVAVAAGIDDDDITFKDGVINIEGDKNIQLYLGSRLIMVDGKPSTMVTEPVVINQRTYVPVAEIANILGLKVEWNQGTQTAIFTK